MPTHQVYIEDGFFVKKHNTLKSYLQEKEALNFISEFTNVTKLSKFDDKKEVLYLKLETNKGSLEHVLSLSILNKQLLEKYWNILKNTLKMLHGKKFVHGDYKCKNWIVKENDEIVLCDFDLSIVNCKQDRKYEGDKKKLLFIYYQLYLTRPDDKHHWAYNNDDKHFRNGEQIYDNGPEFQKDLLRLLLHNVDVLPSMS